MRMAVWQARFWVVPDGIPASEAEAAWLGTKMAVDWTSGIGSVLPRGEAWSPDQMVLGRLDSHSIEAWLEQGELASLQVRIDLRSPTADDFAPAVVRWAREVGARFVHPTLAFEVPASTDGFAAALECSPAFRFVTDPVAFLRRISIGGPQDA